jgi:uncharacterized RDD family membrane protein YckC
MRAIYHPHMSTPLKSDLPPPAAPWRRLAAGVYDAFPLLAIWILVTFGVTAARGMQAVPTATVWFQAILLGAAFFYLGLSWKRGGQTMGMRAWRVALVGADGRPVGWGRLLLRFAVMLLSLGAGLLGVLWAFVDRDRRMWHDLAARTRVVAVRHD